jgi:hypothetical protein
MLTSSVVGLTFGDFFQGTNAMNPLSLGADELDSDLYSDLYFLQSSCTVNSTLSFPVQEGSRNFTKGEILFGTLLLYYGFFAETLLRKGERVVTW